MIINENFDCAVIGTFLYGCPDIQELRNLMSDQCKLKGECNISLLNNRSIWISDTLQEDYVHVLSKPAFYIAHKNRSFHWERWSGIQCLTRKRRRQWQLHGYIFHPYLLDFLGRKKYFLLLLQWASFNRWIWPQKIKWGQAMRESRLRSTN